MSMMASLFAEPFVQAQTGGFPSPRASNAENVSIWWHHCASHFPWKYFPHHRPFVSEIHSFPSQRTSNSELWLFLCSYPEQAVQQTVKLPVIWDAMTLLQSYCNALPKILLTWPLTIPRNRPWSSERYNFMHSKASLLQCVPSMKLKHYFTTW